MSVTNDANNNDSSALPTHLIDNSELLFGGTYTREGFDLVITGADGESVVVADYFSFNPPPMLVLANGAGMSPDMVKGFLHNKFEDALYASSADPTGDAAPIQIGTVGFLSGRVIRIGTDGTEEVLKRGDKIFKGDEIQVDGRGFILAKMMDGTRFRLGSDARATFDDFEYDVAAKKGSFEATVTQGAFNYKSGLINRFKKDGDHSKIKTPSAIIGIRGSELAGKVLESGETTVIHSSGVLTVTDPAGNNPVTLNIPGNTSVIILGGQAIFTPQPSAAQQADVQAGMPPPSPEESADKEASEKQQAEEKAKDPVAEETTEETGETGEGEASGDESAAEGASEGEAEGEGEGEGEGDGEETEGEDGEEGDDTEGEDGEEGDDTESDDTEGDGDGETGTDGESGDAAGDDSASTGNEDSAGEDSAGEDGAGEESAGDDTASADGGEEGGDSSDGGDASDGGDDAADVNAETSSEGDGTSSADSSDGSSSDTSSNDSESSSDDGSSSDGASSSSDSASEGASDSASEGASEGTSEGTSSDGTTASDSASGTSSSGSESGAESGSTSETGTSETGSTNTGEAPPPPPTEAAPVDNTPPPAAELPPDNPPIANDDTINISDNASVELAAILLGNDNDPDEGQSPTIIGVTANNLSGTLNFDPASQSLSYVPDPTLIGPLGQGETISETFTYQIQSGDFVATAQATIVLNGSNDAPIAIDDEFTIDENTTLSLGKADGFLANDSDPDTNDTFTVTDATFVSSDATTVVLQGDGSLEFISTSSDVLNALGEGDTFTSIFTYIITDSQGGTSSATVRVIVSGVDDAPITVTDTASLNEGEVTTISPLGNDSDPEGSELVITEITQPVSGSAVLSPDGLTIEYTASDKLDAGELIETFTYTVSDGNLTSIETIDVTVTGINNPPVLVNNPVPAAPLDAGITGPIDITADVLATVSDDSANLTITQLDTTGTIGTVILGSVLYDAKGQFDYLNAGETAIDSFGFTAADPDNLTVDGRYTLTINGVADAPTVNGPLTIDLTTDDVLTEIDLLQGSADVDTSDQGNLVVINLVDSSGTAIAPTSGSIFSIDPSGFNLVPGQIETIVLQYTIADTTGLEVLQTATITITGVNNAPTIAAPLNATVTQNDLSVPLDLLDGAIDLDGDPLTVTNPIFTPVVTGITLSGSQLSVTPGFYDFLAVDVPEVVTISYQIDDGKGSFVDQTATITILGTNDPVTAVDDVFTTVQNTDISGNVLANNGNGADSDIDNDPLSVVVAVTPSTNGGSVSISADGSFIYTPPGGFSGADTFAYTLQDGNGSIATGQVTINVTDVNDPPSISAPLSLSTSEDVPINVAPVISDADVGAGLITVQITTTNGTILINTNDLLPLTVDSGAAFTSALTISGSLADINIALATLDFDPDLDFNGTGQIDITVDDQGNTGAPGPLTDTVSIPITITAVNDSPFIASPEPDVFSSNDTVNTIIDASLIFDDPDILLNGDVLTISLSGVSNPALFTGITATGSTTGFANNIITLDFASGTGTSTVTINVSDSQGLTSTDTILVTLSPNSPPAAGNDSFTTLEDTVLTTTLGVDDLLQNDNDPEGGVLLVNTTPLGDVINGSLTLNADGTFSYTPILNFSGTDTFQYQVVDDAGNIATGTVSITISPVSDPPILTNDTYSIAEDNTLITTDAVDDLDVNDLPGDGGTLSVSTTPVVDVSNGTLTINVDGSFSYTPFTDFAGTDTFLYQVQEITSASGTTTTLTSTASVSITVTPVNDAPIAVSDIYALTQGSTLTTTLGVDDLLLNDTDVDNDPLTVSITPIVGVANGSLTLNADGTFIYTPTAGFTGTDTFTYQISDTGALTSQVAVTLNVGPPPLNFSVGDGLFSSGAVWSLGTAPTVLEAIQIASGTTVTTAGDALGFQSLIVDGNFDVFGGSYDGPGTMTIGMGTLTHQDTATINVPLIIDPTGTLNILAVTSNSALTISSGFTNSGLIIIDNADAGTGRTPSLTVTTGSLINVVGATILLDNTGGNASGTRNINAQIDNQGLIDVNFDTNLTTTTTFTTDLGSVDVAAGAILTVNATTTDLGIGTTLSGAGQINFIGNNTLNLTGDILLDDISSPSITFGGLSSTITVSGPGILTIASGTQLLLDADVVNSDLLISSGSQVKIVDAPSTIGSVNLTLDGTLVVSSSNLGTGTLNISNGFTNNGSISIDSEDAITGRTTSIIQTGILVNGLGATISFNNTGGVLGGSRDFIGDIDNNMGTLDVNFNSSISGSANFISDAGTIDVAAGATLTIGATNTTLGAATVLSGLGGIDLIGNQTLTLSGNLVIDGTTQPTLSFGGFSSSITVGGPGTLTIQTGTQLFLEADVINSDVTIDAGATVKVIDTTSTIGSTLFTQNGQLVVSSTTQGPANLNISNSFTNAGSLSIDNEDGVTGRVTTLTQIGTLINGASGVISFNNTGGVITGSRDIVGNVDNGTGTLDVNFNATISGSTAFISDQGVIDIDSSAVLTIDSTNSTLGIGTTLIGGGTLDFVNAQTLTLSGNFTINGATSANVKLGGFASAITIEGPGTLTIDGGGQLILDSDTINAPLTITAGGQLKAIETTSTIGSASISQSGLLVVASTTAGASTLNITNGFTNNGSIVIDNEDNVTGRTTTLTQTTGILLNMGNVRFENSGGAAGGSRNFNGSIDNQGIFDVDYDSTISTAGSFLTANGIIDVATGTILTISAADTTVDSGTTFFGGGQINLTGTQSLTALTDFVVTVANAEILFGGSITVGGAGKFIITGGGRQRITADVFNNNLDINIGGELEVREGASDINSTLFGLNGELFVNSTTLGAASVTIANGFTNNGLITIDSEDAVTGRVTSLTVTTGTLINGVGSAIDLVNTGGNAGGSRDILAQLDNQGELKVAHDATLNQAAAAHTNAGEIIIAATKTLTVAGTSLTNQTSGFIEGGGTLDISALTFTNDGFLVPGGRNLIDTLTINGTFAQSASSILLVDVANTGSFDVLNVVGDYSIVGAVDLNFQPGNGITGIGEVITVVTASSITAGSYAGGVTHNLGNAFTVTATQNATNVDVTINATFDVSFDNGGGDGLWATATNWSADTLPATIDNVLIDGFNVTHASAAVDVITSLTLQGASQLNLTGGQITTSLASTFFSGSTFTLDGGTFQADVGLTINGAFNFTSGTLTGATTRVAGTLSTPIGSPKTIDGTLEIVGSGLINNTSIIDGIGLIQIAPPGSLLVDGSTINIDINNSGSLQAEGTTVFGGANFLQDGNLTIQSNPSGTVILSVDATSGFVNNGNLVLDSTNAATATIIVTNGTLLNSPKGVILSTSSNATSGNLREINATVDNQGRIQVDYDLTINQAGNFDNLGSIDINAALNIVTSTSFLNSTGNININAGGALNISATGGSQFSGANFTGTGSIALLGTQTLTLTGDLNFSSGSVLLDLSAGTVDITTGVGAKIQLSDSGQLTLSGDSVATSVDIDNFGSIIALNTSAINSTVFNQNGSLTVSTDGSGAGSLTIANGFTNTGTITLDAIVAGTTTLTVGGILTNAQNGQIVSVTSNATVGTSRVINTNFLNQGVLTVNDELTINDTGTFTNAGIIDINSTGSLIITSSIGADNNGQISLNGVSGVTAASTILDVSGVVGAGFTNNGIITGIGTIVGTISGNAPTVGASPGLVTISEDFIAGESSVLDAELEGEEAGISYDQLAVLGNATLKGSLNATLLNNYQPLSGTAYAILTAGLLLGSFDEANGLDFSDNEVLDLNYDDNMVTLSLIETTNVGTASNDSIITTDNNSVIVAGAGNDLIESSGSNSIIYAQAGNDVIAIQPDFKRVDGGEGIDTLVIEQDIDLTELQGTQIDRIEVISLDDNDTETIDLDSDAIANSVDGNNELTGIDNSLVVVGNLGDTINLNGDFIFSGESTLDAGRGDESFRAFSDGESTLFISNEISLDLTSSDGIAFVFSPGEIIGSELLVQSQSETVSEDSIDLSGVTSLPSTAPNSVDLAGLDLSDLLDNGSQNDLNELLGGIADNVIDLGSAISAIGSNQTNSTAGGGDALTTYYSDGSSIQFVIYANLSDGESFL